jgi:hypothetical protein
MNPRKEEERVPFLQPTSGLRYSRGNRVIRPDCVVSDNA